jgi:hypothetical protein
VRGAVAPALAASGMGLVVVLAKHAFLDRLPDTIRLVPIALIGAITYAGLIALFDRALVKELMSFIQRRAESRS